MKPNILVYGGYYFRENIGDDLFMSAFVHLFPDYNFSFVDQITVESLQNKSAVFFGGGSFLFAAPNIDELALPIVKSLPIFYIGVGTETDIHFEHEALMLQAKLIATRTPPSADRAKDFNANTFYIPDLAYALKSKLVGKAPKKPKSVLVLPNAEVLPQWNSLQWKVASWNYFKSEFAQFLDTLLENKYQVDFFPMCSNPDKNDEFAAVEIINNMQHRKNNSIIKNKVHSIQLLNARFSAYDIIISQRFHGVVLADMFELPCLNIYHHDKLKNQTAALSTPLSFYGLSKQELLDSFHATLNLKTDTVLPIESDIFGALKEAVGGIISSKE